MKRRCTGALIVNARVATFDPGTAAPYGVADDADAIAVRDGRITWIGGRTQRPQPRGRMGKSGRARVVDAEGAWVTPGLIDCHTHLVYAGSRARNSKCA